MCPRSLALTDAMYHIADMDWGHQVAWTRVSRPNNKWTWVLASLSPDMIIFKADQLEWPPETLLLVDFLDILILDF